MEPKHLPKSSISAVAIILITALLHFPASFSQEALPYDSCEPSQCGDIVVDYPFSGPNRPVYCGHPGFQLTCQTDVPIFRSESVSYRVREIDSTTQTLTLARNDLWTNNCPPYLYNTTFDAAIFNGNNFRQGDISLYYRCGSSSGATVSAPNQFRCNVNRTETESYFISTRLAGNLPTELVPCTDHIIVPVNQTWVDRWALGTVMDGDLSSALTDGFRLQWTANDTECGRCVDSGGRCGSNTTFPALFACYCANGNFSLTCNNSYESANEGSSNNGTLTIVLPIVGAIVAGICIGWGVFVCRQRRRRSRAIAASKTESKGILTSDSSKELATNPTSTFTSSIPSYPSSRTMGLGKSTYFGAQVFTYEELELATDNFVDSRELGNGGFGTVYYGKLIDGREVAVKRLYENNFKRVEQFMNEVEILTKLHHENLVKLYGCTSKRSRELILVYEYIANGTVADHLHGKLANSNPGSLTWAIRLNIAIETANALTYLHESDIIHRDVKTNNILLDNNFRVKVADFGLSRLYPNDATHVSTAPQGTPGYVDPEYYQCYRLTDKSDVYSFGVVLIELVSALQAVDINRHRHDINLANMAINKIQNRTLAEMVDKSIGFETNGSVRRAITLVAELAFRCLQSEKDMRPTMKEVVETLRGLQDEEFNVQKPEVLDIVVDDGALLKGYNTNPSSPESGVTDKLVGRFVLNSSSG